MRRFGQLALTLGLAATVAACSGNDRADSDAATAARDTGAAVGTSGAADADRDFIQDQLEDGHAEITLGRLAAERATHPQVKEFAQMMVRDHQMAGEELRQMATQHNLRLEPVAENLDGDHKDLQEELMELSGRDFDKKYMDTMVKEHEEAVDEVEKKAESNDSAARAWATKTLPKLRQHLEQAKQIQQALDR